MGEEMLDEMAFENSLWQENIEYLILKKKWKMSCGTEIKIKKMSAQHLENTFIVLERTEIDLYLPLINLMKEQWRRKRRKEIKKARRLFDVN